MDCFVATLLAMTGESLSRHHFLDFAQLLLAEEYLVADEEGRRAEGAALDRFLGVLDQLCLDVGLLARASSFAPSRPDEVSALAATSRSSIFFGSTHIWWNAAST